MRANKVSRETQMFCKQTLTLGERMLMFCEADANVFRANKSFISERKCFKCFASKQSFSRNANVLQADANVFQAKANV